MTSPFTVLLSRRFIRHKSASRGDSGQSLIETAFVLPFLLLIALNAINFGYFFFTAINLAAAPRDAVEYSIQGFQTPNQLAMPAGGPVCSNDPTSTSVGTLAYNDITGVLSNSSSQAACPNIAYVQVCSGSATSSGTTTCTNYGTLPAGATPNLTVATDPEAPSFLLNRVDIVYQVKPLIPGNVFGIRVLPTYTFHRQVSMRQLN